MAADAASAVETRADYQVFACDICQSEDAVELNVSRRYCAGHPVHVCRNCGFVYVRERRSEAAIADVWSDEVYGDEGVLDLHHDPSTFLAEFKYTAQAPHVRARQTFVAELLAQTIGLEGREVCDIGAGEGNFLAMIGEPRYGASGFGIEPSAQNCRRLEGMGIPHFVGSFGAYLKSPDHKHRRFDLATIMWTLENCQSCRAMMEGVYDILKDGGHVLVATGSRILVPFKKPLHYYLSRVEPPDTHPARFSFNSLRGLLAVTGFETIYVNQFIDSDYLCVIGKKTDRSQSISWEKDDWRAVQAFFDRWAQDTEAHFADA